MFIKSDTVWDFFAKKIFELLIKSNNEIFAGLHEPKKIHQGKIKEYVDILNKLRVSNVSSEIYPGEGKLKKQMEYANKIGSPAVILYGDDEIKSGKATLKNLKTGNESSVKIEDLANEIKKLS